MKHALLLLIAAAVSLVPIASNADDSKQPYNITGVVPSMQNTYDGKPYIQVSFRAKANQKTKKVLLVVKSACRLGNDTLVDKEYTYGMGLRDLDVGESAQGTVSFWRIHSLPSVPTSCIITFGIEKGLGGDDTWDLGSWSFAP